MLCCTSLHINNCFYCTTNLTNCIISYQYILIILILFGKNLSYDNPIVWNDINVASVAVWTVFCHNMVDKFTLLIYVAWLSLFLHNLSSFAQFVAMNGIRTHTNIIVITQILTTIILCSYIIALAWFGWWKLCNRWNVGNLKKLCQKSSYTDYQQPCNIVDVIDEALSKIAISIIASYFGNLNCNHSLHINILCVY